MQAFQTYLNIIGFILIVTDICQTYSIFHWRMCLVYIYASYAAAKFCESVQVDNDACISRVSSHTIFG